MNLRPYQREARSDVERHWSNGARNVLSVLPTGAGKTIMFTSIMADHDGPSIAIAHRQELVGQISVALGRHRVKHRIIGPRSVVKFVIGLHMDELGVPWYDPNAQVAVAGVDTLIRRGDELASWLPRVTLWVQDEAHHILRSNKWGKAVKMLPNARGLGVTATPVRADGRGLGRQADGVFDVLLEGLSMRQTIGIGYLTDYRIFAPTTKDLQLDEVAISSSTGDYSAPQLKTAVRQSRIVGDVVEQYQRIAAGKLGLTFTTDVETAGDISAAYNAAGVSAEVITYKTSDPVRAAILKRYRNREILQLVNVDLFGEGFDLPAVEVVSFARPTQSYGLYAQQFGRGLRPLEGKSQAIIIDHVGNVIRHGLPDANRTWTLDRRVKRQEKDPNVIPVRSCPECTAVYERIHRECPYCGHYPEPANRSAPELVDGDLFELDEETLARMRGGSAAIDKSEDLYRAELVARGCPRVGVEPHVRRHMLRQEAQRELREVIALWAGKQRAARRPDSESYRRFYHRFGIDVLGAQALGKAEADELRLLIDNGDNKG